MLTIDRCSTRSPLLRTDFRLEPHVSSEYICCGNNVKHDVAVHAVVGQLMAKYCKLHAVAKATAPGSGEKTQSFQWSYSPAWLWSSSTLLLVLLDLRAETMLNMVDGVRPGATAMGLFTVLCKSDEFEVLANLM